MVNFVMWISQFFKGYIYILQPLKCGDKPRDGQVMSRCLPAPLSHPLHGHCHAFRATGNSEALSPQCRLVVLPCLALATCPHFCYVRIACCFLSHPLHLVLDLK